MMQEFVQNIKDTIDEGLDDVHTALPAEIVSVDGGLATVLPTMMMVMPNGTKIDYPQISDVPIVFPQGSGQDVSITYPVKAGDSCLLIVAEQSLEYWLYGRETDTSLKFDLSNAICIPGLFSTTPDTFAEACDTNSVIVKSGDTKLSVSPDCVTVDANLIVNGDIELDGNISVTGDEEINGNSTVDGDMSVSGNSAVDGDMSVTGNSAVNGDMSVTGNSTVSGDMSINGSETNSGLTVNGNSTVSGDMSISGKETNTGLTVNGSSTVSGDMSISGSETNAGLTVNGNANVTGNQTVGGSLTVSGTVNLG